MVDSNTTLPFRLLLYLHRRGNKGSLVKNHKFCKEQLGRDLLGPPRWVVAFDPTRKETAVKQPSGRLLSACEVATFEPTAHNGARVMSTAVIGEWNRAVAKKEREEDLAEKGKH